MKNKIILDACCGGRMMWYDKKHPNALYIDNRRFSEKLTNGQNFSVDPDVFMDYRKMDFPDERFNLVVFDPPHIKSLGKKSWMSKKYGVLESYEDIVLGFNECWRVLKTGGTLVFKWSMAETRKSGRIKIADLLKKIGKQPLFGTRPGSRNKTYWLVFMKI